MELEKLTDKIKLMRPSRRVDWILGGKSNDDDGQPDETEAKFNNVAGARSCNPAKAFLGWRERAPVRGLHCGFVLRLCARPSAWKEPGSCQLVCMKDYAYCTFCSVFGALVDRKSTRDGMDVPDGECDEEMELPKYLVLFSTASALLWCHEKLI